MTLEKHFNSHYKIEWLKEIATTPCQQDLWSPNLGSRKIQGTDSIHVDLKDNNDVVIVRSCDFGKTLYFSFRKDHDDRTLNDNKHQLSLN